MDKLLLKYNSLDAALQRQVEDFVDFLLTVKKHTNPKKTSNYKKKILKVSTWKEQNLEIFNGTKNGFQQWNIQEHKY